jgi:phage shock protein A
MMAGPMTRNHVAGSALMDKKLEEREAEFKARLQKLKDQRKALKEDMKRLKKKIKELKGSTLNLPQGEGDDDEQD